jgi:hypothetical protein
MIFFPLNFRDFFDMRFYGLKSEPVKGGKLENFFILSLLTPYKERLIVHFVSWVGSSHRDCRLLI